MILKHYLFVFGAFLVCASAFGMEAETESYMAKKTRYVVELGGENPYGKGCSQFPEQSKAFIDKLLQHPDQSFNNWMYLASKERFLIAKKNQTPSPERFGRKREAAFLQYSTSLHDPRYSEYEKIFSDKIAAIERENKQEDEADGTSSSFELRSIDKDKVLATQIRQCQDDEIRFDPAFNRYIYLEAFKSRNPAVYASEVLKSAMTALEEGSEPYIKNKNQKFHYFHGVRRLALNGKMYAIGQYLLKIGEEDNEGYVTVIHQDNFLIKDSLAELSTIFEKAMSWNATDSIETLKSFVGHFRYLFAYAMPFERGSAAIAEFIEAGIYKKHGLSFTLNSDVMVDLEALTSSFSEFMNRYNEYTVLKS